MDKYHLVQFHSYADVITNSSSELFMIASAMEEDAIKQIVANLLGCPADTDYVNVSIFNTFNEFLEFLIKHGNNSFTNLNQMVEIGCPGTNVCLGFEPETKCEAEFNSFSELQSLIDVADERNKAKIQELIEAERETLEKAFKPVMLISSWCDEDTDYEPITQILKGVRCGGY